MKVCSTIFDLDGVLCYTGHYRYLVWKAVADRLSLPFDEQVSNHLRGASRMKDLEVILGLGNKTYSQEEKEQMVAERNWFYHSYLECVEPEALAPGAVDVLHTLQGNGWRTGIDSSSKDAPLILERVGLDGFFNAAVDGSQTTKSRPDPGVFRLVARKLHLSPDECVVVEDASAGILVTDAGGFFPIGPGDTTQAPGRHAVPNALYELLELCRRLYSHAPRFKSSDPTPFSQGGGAAKKKEHPPGRRCGSVEICRNVHRVALSAGKRVFVRVLPLWP